MIGRYTRPEMKRIWSEENKFRKMTEVEILACEAMARYGMIPRKAASAIRRRADFDVDRIKEIEKSTNHDVIAFLANLSENIGDDAKYVHKGLTSSDVLDTALSALMVEAAGIIIADLKKLVSVFRRKAIRYKDAVMIGRSHGVHAEPTTFGLKMALFYDETRRDLERMIRARETVRVGKISGAVGTYANVDPRVEEYVCRKMGLKPASVSTQIVQRDRHAEYLTTMALIGSSLDKFAVEIRALQRTEIGEAGEYFSPAQKGSSAMPHKKNPIICERISGMARILRGNAHAALENVALWHERDISHSSVERVIIPDSTSALDYMLAKTIDVFHRLVVNTERMKENIGMTKGYVFSQRVLIELINKGATRLEAYDMVQKCAMKARDEDEEFKDVLMGDREVRGLLTRDEVEDCFDLSYHLKNVDKIFRKAGI